MIHESAPGFALYDHGKKSFERDPIPSNRIALALRALLIVHALQIQEMFGSGYIPGSWITTYVTCFLTSGLSTDCNNEIEKEAYEYANGCPRTGGSDLRICLIDPDPNTNLANVGPCDCTSLPPFRETQVGGQTFLDIIRSHCPLIPKQHASSTIGILSCIARLCQQIPVLGCILGFGAFVIGFFIGLISIFGIPGLTGTIGRIGARRSILNKIDGTDGLGDPGFAARSAQAIGRFAAAER